MTYSSLQEIIADQGLGLTNVEPTVDAVQRAINDKLRSMQAETATQTTETYRRLIDARTSLDELSSANNERGSTELVPMPAAVVERLLDIIQKPNIAAEPPKPPIIERMQTNRSVAITKASQDFRNRRALPLAGLGTIVAALWGTRQAFGANLSHVGTVVWAAVSAGIVVIVFMLLILVRQAQSRGERALRRFYDPDVQADALRSLRDEMDSEDVDYFTRRHFRDALGSAAYYGHKQLYNVLSTIDFSAALEDATELAIARFVEMKVLTSRQDLGQELFIFHRKPDPERAAE
jgi:hypothetical protein